MEQIKQLPVDFNTWKQLDYDENYFVPIAQDYIKLCKNQLKLPNLTNENINKLRESIDITERMIK